jgi:hypothetical protein
VHKESPYGYFFYCIIYNLIALAYFTHLFNPALPCAVLATWYLVKAFDALD